LSETELKELVIPGSGEILGRVLKLLGGDHLLVKCADGETRLCRIRGRMKRRMWIREDDIVLIAPWEFDNRKADVVWRYIRAHVEWLAANNYLPEVLKA